MTHLPMGLLTSVAVWDLAALVLDGGVWWTVSFWSLALGVAAAGLAMLTGLLDLAKVEDPAADRAARRHMYAALAAVACYGSSLVIRGGSELPADGYAFAFALSYLGFGFLVAAGWLGGDLVFRHGVGSGARDGSG